MNINSVISSAITTNHFISIKLEERYQRTLSIIKYGDVVKDENKYSSVTFSGILSKIEKSEEISHQTNYKGCKFPSGKTDNEKVIDELLLSGHEIIITKDPSDKSIIIGKVINGDIENTLFISHANNFDEFMHVLASLAVHT